LHSSRSIHRSIPIYRNREESPGNTEHQTPESGDIREGIGYKEENNRSDACRLDKGEKVE